MLHTLSALDLRERFINGTNSAQEITTHFLNRVKLHDPKVCAFLEVFAEDAMQKAKVLDEKRSEKKPLGVFAGVPVAIKDNLHMKGKKTTCGSKILQNFTAPFSATCCELLEEQDAILIGKTNLDEFAMGSSTENSAFFKTKNPWDLACTPGGSSGGSAAAVSARFCPVALGTDTGGSVRQPAALCGIVGLKPTYGRVSRWGVVAYGSSLDQVGPMSSYVEDTALLMETIGRHCEKDSTSIDIASDQHLSDIKNFKKGLRIGVPWQFLEGLNEDTASNFKQALKVFESYGATIYNIDLSILKYSLATYYILAPAEASTNLARYDGIRYGLRSKEAKSLDEVYDYTRDDGFGSEVKRRIMLGTFVLSSGYKNAYYRKAQQVRTKIIDTFKEAFKACDLVAIPCVPNSAFELGSIKDPLSMYLEDIYTIAANLTGLPAISLPSGFCKKSKPLGLQLIAPELHEKPLLQASYFFQQETKFNQHIPSLFKD